MLSNVISPPSRATTISDDNFNKVLQRTLLLQFVLKDEEQAKARPPG
ncbi:hypothetical protein [Hyphomicrobium sp. ghe19]|nr:hypothetical protein HYPP_03966 [Hyphomicrobium sp. ghe19]